MTTVRTQIHKELTSQDLSTGKPNPKVHYMAIAQGYAEMEGAIAVLSDMCTRQSWVYLGAYAQTLGIKQSGNIKSIWEEEILMRMPEEDREDKYLQELRFFHFINQQPRQQRKNYCLVNPLRLRDDRGELHFTTHREFFVPLKERGLWLSICLYQPFDNFNSLDSFILNLATGQIVSMGNSQDDSLLSTREKEVLCLIEQGLATKQIAERLAISSYTVSRHRQNLMAKLGVRSALQACSIARKHGLIH